MAEVQWYYARNDQQFGPVSAAELKQLADAGRLSPDDLLWREGMDSWATAINLRGLFAAEDASRTPSGSHPSLADAAPATSKPIPLPAQSGVPLSWVLNAVQVMLWTTSVLVVLAGMVLFTRAFLVADSPTEEAAAAAVSATFFLGAYVLARSGEKLAGLLRTRRHK